MMAKRKQETLETTPEAQQTQGVSGGEGVFPSTLSTQEPLERGEKVAKIALAPNEVEITSANTFEEVLKYDQEGKRLLFACEKGQFLELTDEETRQLSAFTKVVYSTMRAQNKLAEAEDDDWAEVKANLKIGETRGSARARMQVTSLDKGATGDLETRTFRPDNVANGEAKGWKIASKKRWSMPGSQEGHIGIRNHGEDELILMERPKSFREAQEKAKRERKQRQRESEKEAFLSATTQMGYRPLRDAEVAENRFHEIE